MQKPMDSYVSAINTSSESSLLMLALQVSKSKYGIQSKQHLVVLHMFLAHLSRRLRGELLVYQSDWISRKFSPVYPALYCLI